MHILIIDNNDSFTRNLEHLLAMETGASVRVEPYTRLAAGGLDSLIAGQNRASCPDLLVLSPGPGRPADYPAHARAFDSGLPVLGICLGMQALNEHFGGTTERLTPGHGDCMHGKTERISLAGRTLAVARYHSLYCSKLGAGMVLLAENGMGVPMALRHETRPMVGYQFHPESFMTEHPGAILDHALELLDLP